MPESSSVSAPARSTRAQWVILATFCGSGFASLIYEVSWSRQVGTIAGHTAASAAWVLAAFFIGQAIGNSLGERLASLAHPLKGYAAVELAAAAWAALLPSLFTVIDLAPLAGLSLPTLPILRSLLCFISILPAAVMLGASFPLIADALSPQGNDQIRRVIWSYGFNTLGGMLGVVFSLLQIASIGVRQISLLAAVLSAACGLLAWWLAQGDSPRPAAPPLPAPDRSPKPSAAPFPRIWFAVAAVSGFAALGLEVLYTRLFSLVFHNSTYTFGIVLILFLAGLALGAGLAELGHRYVTASEVAGFGAVAGAAAIALLTLLFVRWTGLEYLVAGRRFETYLVAVSGLVAATILIPVTLLGMMLPTAYLQIKGHGGRLTGRLAAANAAAAATGALAIGELAIPSLGLWRSLSVLTVLLFVTGTLLLLRQGERFGRRLAVVATAALLLGLFWPSSAYEPALDRNEVVLKRWESRYGRIDVVRSATDGALKIRQNLHYRHGSTGSNAVREYRQGRLPLLLHPHPERVAFLGLGTGLTAAPAIVDRDVLRIDAIELIPEVVKAARMLSEANLNLPDHPKVRVRVDDARHFLRQTDQSYDVIVSDLFVPWESRTGYLYTVEHYAVARQRLKPGGLFCQWIPLYQVGAAEFEMIADSFATAFSETTVWWGHLDPDFALVALIGSDSPLNADPASLDRRWARLGSMPTGVDPVLPSPQELPDLFLGQWEFRSDRPLNTDEHPIVEFSAPLSDRSGRTLTGHRLRHYFDAVLATLPAGRTRLGRNRTAAGDAHQARHALQRFILFAAAPQDRERP